MSTPAREIMLRRKNRSPRRRLDPGGGAAAVFGPHLVEKPPPPLPLPPACGARLREAEHLKVATRVTDSEGKKKREKWPFFPVVYHFLFSILRKQ